jgi:hypothetical protein
VGAAAFAPARQLGGGRRAGSAGSVRMHMSAADLDLAYIVDARVAQDWSLSGEDAAEGVVADVACYAVKSATKDAISVEAVAKAHAETVAFDRWA